MTSIVRNHPARALPALAAAADAAGLKEIQLPCPQDGDHSDGSLFSAVKAKLGV